MATNPINTVPLGTSGTGSAFVLGQSQAANKLLENIDANQRLAIQQEQQREAKARQIADQWNTNALKVDGGLYWQPEFNKNYQNHLEEGIQLRQMGINPFNYNPNDPVQAEASADYLLKRQRLLSDTANRKAIEGEVKKTFDLLRKDPSKYYQSDIEALNNYVQLPYSEASQMPIPTLTERFQPNAVLSKVIPAQEGNEIVVGNKRIKSVKGLPNETRNAIVSAYVNDPNTARWVNEITGRQGFTIPQLEKLPLTREGIRKKIEDSYKGNPDLRVQLAQQGITPDSDSYRNYVADETNRLLTAKNIWEDQISGALSQVLPRVKEMSSTLPDYTSQKEADRRQGVSQRNIRFAERNDKKGMSETSEDTLFRQQLVSDILNQVPNSGERLKQIVDVDPRFEGQKLKIEIDGPRIKFRAPAHGNIPQRTVIINREESNSQSKLNKFINELTGETISDSKFNTGEPSGKIKDGKVVSNAPVTKSTPKSKTATTSQIKSLVGKPGYEGYTEKELTDYYRSQGYTIK